MNKYLLWCLMIVAKISGQDYFQQHVVCYQHTRTPPGCASHRNIICDTYFEKKTLPDGRTKLIAKRKDEKENTAKRNCFS